MVVFAIKRGLPLHDLASASDLSRTDAEGLSAYACAAALLNPSLCLHLECLGVASTLSSDQGNFSFPQIRAALHQLHRHDSLHLQILFTTSGNEHVAGWFDFWGDFLEHGGPEHVHLPVDGYWQWCGEWQLVSDEASHLLFHSHPDHRLLPPPGDGSLVWCRLRKRRPAPAEFASAVETICAAEDEYYAAGMQAIPSVIDSFQSAITTLMTGIRSSSTDPQAKSKAATYLQLVMQRLDQIAPALASTNASTCSIPLSHANASTASLPAVTKTFPALTRNYLSRLFRGRQRRSTDELQMCPVCSVKLALDENDRVQHLNECLTRNSSSILGDRYTVHVLNSPDPRECPICYEEFHDGRESQPQRIAVMNCLCRFHERCIERWFKRSASCPFHSD